MYNDDNRNDLAGTLKKENISNLSPVMNNIQSGIYHAITVAGKPDPEGRGRIAAYVPKLGGNKERPVFFQYASPFGGSNASGSYGFHAVPPSTGVTILVFFADNGELSEGYWFAVAQEVPDIAAGGASGKAKVDGTGQGEGVFKDKPSGKINPTELTAAQHNVTSFDDNAPENVSMDQRTWDVATDQNDSGLSSDSSTSDSKGANQVSVVPVTKEVVKSEAYYNDIAYAQGPVTGIEVAAEVNKRLSTSSTSDSNGSGQMSVIPGGEKSEDEVKTGRNQANSVNNGVNSDAGAFDQIPKNHPRNINLAVQGIYSDSVRGQTTASPLRNANYDEPKPNTVYGIKTPGSTALTMDDGSVDDDGFIHPNQIRLQTGSGASIILDGTNDLIYMVNSTGSGFIEIGPSGEVMIYAQGSLSMRTEKDFNLRADQNINIEAAEKINIKSGNNFSVNSGNQTHIKSEGSQFYDSAGNNHTKVGSNMYVSTGGLLHLNGPQAAASPGLSTMSHSDIQNLESSTIDESIMSTMVSHEPMMRRKPAPANTSSGSGATGSANGGQIPSTIPDTNSAGSNTADTAAEQQQKNDQSVDEQVAGGTGTVTYWSKFSGQTRNQVIQPQLFSILETAAKATGVELVIFSGGQDQKGMGNRRTGGIGHDNGYGADVWLYKSSADKEGGKISLHSDVGIFKKFAKECYLAGANAVGAGIGYMGDTGVHVDIATYRNDQGMWGKTKSWRSAPAWLKQARDEGGWKYLPPTRRA
jgi:hypothetical protein